MTPDTTDWIIHNASSLGAYRIWIGEDINVGQDIFVLTAVALLRSSVNVGTAIVPIATHHLIDIARAGVPLCELDADRFTLGIGIGGLQDLERAGIRLSRPVTALKNSVIALRSLWSGESVTIDTGVSALDKFQLRLTDPIRIPLFLGVRGPQMLKLAGQIADGVILSGPIDYLRYAMSLVASSATRTGRDPSEIQKVVWLPTIPTFKGGTERLAKKIVAVVVADTPDPVIDLLNIDGAQVRTIKRVVQSSGPSKAVSLVTREIMDMFAISGTCTEMVDQFEILHNIGADEVVLGPPFTGDWHGSMTDIFAEIHRRSAS